MYSVGISSIGIFSHLHAQQNGEEKQTDIFKPDKQSRVGFVALKVESTDVSILKVVCGQSVRMALKQQSRGNRNYFHFLQVSVIFSANP